jgi:fructose-bisphosphate aldolase class I
MVVPSVPGKAIMNNEQLTKMRTGSGFIAALDQSGGSTPKALSLYGIGPDRYSDEDTMFDLIHAMRTRMMTNPAFGGDRIIGAILFEGTMERSVEGLGSAEYLWQRKGIVPFLKVDKGLADEVNGVQMMKPMPDLGALLSRALERGVFGTKMRSVIKDADPGGIRSVVAQQFEVGRAILASGLIPIIEPEVDIHSPRKAEAEEILLAELNEELSRQAPDAPVMLKLTLPEKDGFYSDLVAHRAVVRVVALSGGYSRDESNARLSRNPGMIASFSRALTEGLADGQTDEEFTRVLDATIASICAASAT